MYINKMTLKVVDRNANYLFWRALPGQKHENSPACSKYSFKDFCRRVNLLMALSKPYTHSVIDIGMFNHPD